jgi:hypothetical protein
MPDPAFNIADDSVVEIDLPDDFDPNTDKPTVNEVSGAQAAPPPQQELPLALPPEPQRPSVDDAAAILQRTLEEERNKRIAAEQRASGESQARLQAERLAQQREHEVQELRTSSAAGRMRETLQQLDSTKAAMQSAKAAYTAAHEAGDAGKLADAHEQMSMLGADIRMLQMRKNDLEAEVQRVEREPAPQYQQYTGSPVEEYLSRLNLSPRAAQWLRTHPDCLPSQLGGNIEKNAAMLRADHLAKGYGIQVDSDDYYRVIEEETGYRPKMSQASQVTPAQSPGQAAQPAAPAQPQRAPVPAARPSNEPPTPTPSPQRSTYRLDKSQQEHALISFPQNPGEDERDWHKRAFGHYTYNLNLLTKEGKMNRTHI